MAAFAAAAKIDAFAYMPLQDFGNAFSTFIAQNYGAQEKERIRRGMRVAVMTFSYTHLDVDKRQDKNGLLAWLKGFQKEPKHIFLVHGEPEAKEAFAEKVEKELGYHPIVVKGNSEYVLEKDEIVKMCIRDR